MREVLDPLPVGWLVGANSDGNKLVDVLKRHLVVLPLPAIGPLLAMGGCRIGGMPISGPEAINRRVQPGDRLDVGDEAIATVADLLGRPVTIPSPAPLTVVFEDEDLLVVDKPPGQHVHPMGRHRRDTMIGALLWHAGARSSPSGTITRPWGDWRPHPVHRLDRATGGLVLVATSARMAMQLSRARDRGRLQRTYLALVRGHVAQATGTIDQAIGPDPSSPYRRAVVAAPEGKPAVTHHRRLATGPGWTLLEVTLETGRTHQIRVHLAALGHPIVGDELYDAAEGSTFADAGAPRSSSPDLRLHAVGLRFPHPRTGAPVELEARPSWPELAP